MRIVMRKEFRYVQIVALATAALLYLGLKTSLSGSQVPEKDVFLIVKRVVDGDTLKLSNSKTVRLIGIDTPELHYSSKLARDAKRSRKDIDTIRSLGKRAAHFTKTLVSGKKVRLEFDVAQKDRYGRLLAYLYLEDGTFVNAEIVKQGYAKIMTVPPNVRYAEYFVKLEREARADKRGLWGEAE